jgi:hypothetical protein
MEPRWPHPRTEPAALPVRATTPPDRSMRRSMPHQEWSWSEPRFWPAPLLTAPTGVKDGTPNALFAEYRLFGLHDACVLSASPLAGEPSTGEPDAGDPHVRFGGRGRRTQSTLPTPTIAEMDPDPSPRRREKRCGELRRSCKRLCPEALVGDDWLRVGEGWGGGFAAPHCVNAVAIERRFGLRKLL